MLIRLSQSEEETYLLGKWIGKNAIPGDLIFLFGDLGSGKTVFSRGVAQGAGFTGIVTSPTFNLMNVYEGNYPIYHFDVYRLNEPEELYDLDYEEYFYGDGIAIVEWPERLDYLLPSDYLKVALYREQEDNRRKITIEVIGSYNDRWKGVLKNYESTSN